MPTIPDDHFQLAREMAIKMVYNNQIKEKKAKKSNNAQTNSPRKYNLSVAQGS